VCRDWRCVVVMHAPENASCRMGHGF
jgi:hypothetical protein